MGLLENPNSFPKKLLSHWFLFHMREVTPRELAVAVFFTERMDIKAVLAIFTVRKFLAHFCRVDVFALGIFAFRIFVAFSALRELVALVLGGHYFESTNFFI